MRTVSLEDLAGSTIPELKIKDDLDVEAWKGTRGYADYSLFLRRLCESVVGYNLPYDSNTTSPINRLLTVLAELSSWVDDIPPLPTPQRFGNLAFRAWGQRLDTETDRLLSTLLEHSPHHATAVAHVKPYLLISFGSFTRMDYGTGHETGFALFLCALALLGFFRDGVTSIQEQERQLVLIVFPAYLRLVWRLQDVYRLEPAGSHGVWGLDDYSFLGYIFGSAQLLDQEDIPPSAILQPLLPDNNLYFMQISRIRAFKSGPFYEHSSQLYSIATSVPNWTKVHNGLIKMYEAEVLGKRVVVQHIPLGGILEWDVTHASSGSVTNVPMVHQRDGSISGTVSTTAPLTSASLAAPSPPPSGTQAPWDRTGSPSAGYSAGVTVPWASTAIPHTLSRPASTIRGETGRSHGVGSRASAKTRIHNLGALSSMPPPAQ
ncbi:Phosphotyrosyl phosphatase activator [Punctularia strigosozonata HHB-11173 SS5]|uniref:Serine/threonine-protein phosphatase 2A activator n=1 Tax=Punctularia strigosozonata (strain HHB-11173) TaxID=741275 RepID=R7S136_PUNST|nr:Phosphotyrosyl phosphatase activator [Punctularia strigosozonata HHB-11173 SS5]EIN03933.1 Phosphotyrosyl phosphatase activator [Punctularia strigosozonata HHB-11173 SS5]